MAVAAAHSAGAVAQTPAEIVERAIAAHGGRAALAAATTMVWRAPVTLGAATGTTTRYFKPPDKLRIELTVAMRLGDDEARVDIVRFYDGRTAWTMTEGGGFREDPAQAAGFAEAARRILHLVLRRADAPGVRLEPAPEAGVVMHEAGRSTTLWFDAGTGLVSGLAYAFAVDETRDAVETRLEFSDFRDVGRLRLPYRLVQYRDGKRLGEVAFSSISVGDELADSLFSPP